MFCQYVNLWEAVAKKIHEPLKGLGKVLEAGRKWLGRGT
jgi:hypothetical protein